MRGKPSRLRGPSGSGVIEGVQGRTVSAYLANLQTSLVAPGVPGAAGAVNRKYQEKDLFAVLALHLNRRTYVDVSPFARSAECF